MRGDQRTYLLPGPKLGKLISDQAEQLKAVCPQFEQLQATLWIEEVNGLRQKSCELRLYFLGGEFRVTKSGSTHTLAVMDTIRTLRNRMIRIGAGRK